MKIRNRFVSNSSSSSFIIGFKKKPESIDKMKDCLFPDKDHKVHPYAADYMAPKDVLISTVRISEAVFNDVKDQKPLSEEKLAEILDYGYDDNGPQYNDPKYKNEKGGMIWEIYEKDSKTYYKKKAKELLKAHKDLVFFKVSYSDNDGNFYSAMEHGDMFENIFCIRINCH